MAGTVNKIHIIGEVGSGKTYLARRLSERLGIPFYQLDNVVWKRTAVKDVRNAPEVRDEILNSILESDNWIIEGVHYKWVQRSFELADIIIYLNPHVYKRDRQIVTRYIKQKMGLERGNYKQTVSNLIQMLKWSHDFEIKRKPLIHDVLQPYQHKLRYFTDNREVLKLYDDRNGAIRWKLPHN